LSHPSLSSTYLGEEFPLTELVKRFREEWARRRDHTDTPVTRVASFNLLVVSQGEDEERLVEVLKGLMESHPARVIWTKMMEGRKWEDSTARLHLECGCDGVQVCSEQVQICCGQQPERVASLLLSLIHEGLPTHLLWWKSGPTEGPLFERISDRSQLVLVEPNDWPSFAQSLPDLWLTCDRQEHAFYPLIWYQLTEARQKIAYAYGEGDIELALPKQTNSSTAEADLLTIWLETLLPHSARTSSRARIVSTAECTEPTLNSAMHKQPLLLQSPLDAVRAALNRPTRDPVFKKMIELIKERDF